MVYPVRSARVDNLSNVPRTSNGIYGKNCLTHCTILPPVCFASFTPTPSSSVERPHMQSPYATAQEESRILPCTVTDPLLPPIKPDEVFEGSLSVARARSSMVAIPDPPPVMIIPAGSSPFFPTFFKCASIFYDIIFNLLDS